MEPGCTQQMFWTFCTTLSTHVIANQFPDLFTCGQNWPLNSLILIHVTNFFGGFLKEKIFPQKLQTIMAMRALLTQACSEISEDMCCRVISITVRVEFARCNGDHIAQRINLLAMVFLYVIF
jgi:hypothetical protein